MKIGLSLVPVIEYQFCQRNKEMFLVKYLTNYLHKFGISYLCQNKSPKQKNKRYTSPKYLTVLVLDKTNDHFTYDSIDHLWNIYEVQLHNLSSILDLKYLFSSKTDFDPRPAWASPGHGICGNSAGFQFLDLYLRNQILSGSIMTSSFACFV